MSKNIEILIMNHQLDEEKFKARCHEKYDGHFYIVEKPGIGDTVLRPCFENLI